MSLCSINAGDAAGSAMQKAHSVVCGELMTAVIDVQASTLAQPAFYFITGFLF